MKKMLSSKHLLVSLVVFLIASTNHVVDGAAKKDEELSLELLEAEAAGHVENSSALMGKMFPLFSKLFVRSKKRRTVSFKQVVEAISDLVDERELAIFATVGWGLVPITRNLYECYANARGMCIEIDDEAGGDEEESEATTEVAAPKKSKFRETYEDFTPKLKERLRRVMGSSSSTSEIDQLDKPQLKPFRKTRLFHVVDHISQASKISLSVIAVDCISLISRMMGYNPWNIMESVSRLYSQVVYSGWIAYRLSIMKRFFIEKAFTKKTKKSMDSDIGKFKVVDNLADGMMGVIWVIYILDYLEVHTGVAVKSIFSVGATGTLIFGLASKDIASQIMGGITLHLSDKIFEGDDVRFSDGTSGKIEKMGWFETMIRNSDELVVGIPNTQLSGQRVYNLSRTPRSQVKQELRVSYDDASKITKLLDTIKEEIKADCPKLITDGSRPFRAHWRNYEDDHLQIVVDCHFKIKPTGNEYWDNRQKVLEAIFRAAKKTGVQFETLTRAIKVAA